MDIYDPISVSLGLRPIEHILLKYTIEELILEYTNGEGKMTNPCNPEANKINASLGGKAKAAKKYPAWNKGISTPRSQESIEKQKATITGKKRGPYKNYDYASKSHPIIFRGKEYSSISEARRETGASFPTVKKFMQRLPFPPQSQEP